MHEMCGTDSMPSERNSSTVASVPSRVEPPAPNVTEQNAGLSCFSCRRAARSFSIPSGVRGGKNSRLKWRGSVVTMPCCCSDSALLARKQRRQEPGDDAVDDRAEEPCPEAAHVEAVEERADPPEQETVD